MAHPICLLTALLILPTAAIAQPADSAAAEALRPVLTAVVTPSAENIKLAERAWQLRAGASSDVLGTYAMALACARNNRQQVALEMLEKLPPQVRQAGPLRRFHLWLLVRLRQDEVAQTRLETFIRDLPKRAAQPPTPNDLEDVKFLTGLLTFLGQVEDRADHLTRQQAQAWLAPLQALPPTWREKIDTHQAELLAEHAERQRKVQESFAAWRTKTEAELEDTKGRLTELKAQNTTITQRLEAETTAHQDYVKQVGPQVAALEAQAAPLLAARKALVIPRKPQKRDTSRARDASDKSKIERENELEERRYDKERKEYEASRSRLDAQLAPLDRQLTPLYAAERNLRQKAEKTKFDFDKLQKPLTAQLKNEERLTKILGDTPTWDAPGNLAQLRSLDGYSILAFPAEVERINRALNK